MHKPRQLVQSAQEILPITEKLKTQSMIALDTEFIRETTFFPKVALIQVATEDDVWLIDPLACDQRALQPLLEIFQDPKILKVIHAAYADQECLYWNYQIVANPVLDSAVAGALLGKGDNLGLAKLAKDYLGVNMPKGRARAKWAMRPLPDELAHYAVQDVDQLVRLGKTLLEHLDKKGRGQWAIRESHLVPDDFDISPEKMAVKLARTTDWDDNSFAVLVELVRWREERSRKSNVPRGWIADNEVLTSLAKAKPRSIDQLRVFRGLSPKEVEKQGNAILQAIKTGLDRTKQIVSQIVREKPPPIGDSHVNELLKTFVSYQAVRCEVANRFLLNPANLPKVLQKAEASIDEWVELGLLSRESADLIGMELKEFLGGKKAMAIRNGKVITLTTGNSPS